MGKLAFIILLILGLFVIYEAKAEEPRCKAWAYDLSESRAYRYEQYYTANHPEADRVLAILWEEGVPARYFYLMLAESNARTNAESQAGAVGSWQLTAATARRYGCTDRENVEESTRAAARYIAKLRKDFDGDDWKVIAAYNMGGHNLKAKGATREARALADFVTCLFIKDPFFLDGME